MPDFKSIIGKDLAPIVKSLTIKPKRVVKNINCFMPPGDDANHRIEVDFADLPLDENGALIEGEQIKINRLTLRKDKLDLYPELVTECNAFCEALQLVAVSENL